MRLFAWLAADGPAVGVVDGAAGHVHRVPALDGGLDAALAEDRFEGGLAAARVVEATAGATASGGSGIPLAGLTPLPAIEFPGKVVCVGLNYRDHLEEQHLEPPPRPVLFAKFGNAVVASGEAIVRPEGTHALDLEVELGVVIGRRARRVPVERALEHVAGYVVVNDVSARDWQGNKAALREGERGDGQWLRAKGSDTFLPVGPFFVTAEAFDPGHPNWLRSWRVPGTGPEAGSAIAMQDGSTADMLWPVPELIAFISRAITLEPGDVVASGTPSGVGVFRTPPVFLEPGDRVRCEIEGLGWVENPVVDWSSVPEEA